MHVAVVGVTLLLLALTLGSQDLSSRCTHLSSITGNLKYVDRTNYQLVSSTVINTNIGLGETICFRLMVNKTLTDDSMKYSLPHEANSSDIMYMLTLSEVKQTHRILNSYQTAIAKPMIGDCSCDCPCFTDHYIHLKDYCEGERINPQPCVNIISETQTDNGCRSAPICADSTSSAICSFYVTRDDSLPIYDTMEISTAETWLVFRLEIYEGGNMAKTEEIEFSLQDGRVIYSENRVDSKVSVEGPGIPSIIPAKWYFKESDQPELYTGVEINSMNEWNFQKLGWLRWRAGDVVFPEKFKVNLKNQFSYSYQHCGVGKKTWGFAGSYTSSFMKDASKALVKDQNSGQIKELVAGDRMVIATLKSSPRYSVVLELNETADVIFYFDQSHLVDFSVKLQIDKHSTKFLEFNLVEAAGSIIGFLKTKNETRDFHFSLYIRAVQPSDQTVYTSLPSDLKCSISIQYTVCLRTPNQKLPLCKQATVKCEQLTDFVVPTKDINSQTGDVYSSSSMWDAIMDFLSPIEALINDVTNISAWAGVIVYIVIAVVIIVVIVKLWRICCRKSSGSKTIIREVPTESHVMKRVREIERKQIL